MRRESASRLIALSVLLVATLVAVDAQRGGGGGGGGTGGGFGGGGTGGGTGGFGQGGTGRGTTGSTGFPTTGRGNTQPTQNRPSQDNETPTFRSGVNLVQIDAIVTDASGKPVQGLHEEDFEILEAGKPRRITTFAAVDIPIVDSPPLPPAVEADVVSNQHPPGRTYLIALDEVGADRALRARNMLRRFVEKYMGPNDVAAVALTGRGLADSGQDFTSNKRLVLKAIDKFSGEFAEFDAKANSSSDPRQLASSFRKLTEFLATMPGRKVMIYVGEGIGGLDPHAAVDYRGTSLTPGDQDFHEAMAAATRGNVTIYPIDPRGLTTETTAAESFDTSELDARADLAAIADVTGGFSLTNSNNITEAFERLVRENSSYYTIGFASENERLDGRFTKVEVRVTRPGLQVRSRGGYVAPLQRSKGPAAVAGDARMPTVLTAIGSAVASSDLTMRVSAASYKGTGNNASVVLAVEFDVSKLDLTEKEGNLVANVEITYLATDAKGKVKPGRRHDATLKLKKGEVAERAFKTGVRAVSEFELPKGRYQLRVAVGGTTLAGSVIYDLEIPDYSDGVALSGVTFTTASAPLLTTLLLRDPMGKILPGPPIAFREFSRQDIMAMYVEAYDNDRRTQPPQITAQLQTLEGATVATLTDQKLTPTMHGDAAGSKGMAAALPLQNVAPGNYILHVEARGAEGRKPAQRDVPVRIW